MPIDERDRSIRLRYQRPGADWRNTPESQLHNGLVYVTEWNGFSMSPRTARTLDPSAFRLQQPLLVDLR